MTVAEENEQAPGRVVVQTHALGRPTFLIKLDDKYYSTLAVWEYNPSAPGLTEEQRFQINHLIEVFEARVRDGHSLEAVSVPDYVPVFAGSTHS